MSIGTGFKVFLISLVLVLIMYIFFVTFNQQNRGNTKAIEYIVRSSTESTQDQQKVEPAKEEKEKIPPVDELIYVEPSPAGSGTSGEEMRRFRFFMATQQAVCTNVVSVGGKATVAGKDADGAWRVCYDAQALQRNKPCIVYSFGIARDWTFDEGMEQNGCQVFAFDPSIGLQDHDHSQNIKFYNMGLARQNSEPEPGVTDTTNRKSWKMRSLDSVIQYLGHTDKLIDVVKMDIEWDEWSAVPQMLSSGTLKKYVKQLCIEYHVVDESPGGLRRYFGIAKWLERQGFLLFNKHQNAYCSQCLEMSYVNINLIKLPLVKDL